MSFERLLGLRKNEIANTILRREKGMLGILTEVWN
jgi:hypothetical protein